MPPSRKTFLLPNVGFATRVADENLGSEARKLENFLVHDDTGRDVLARIRAANFQCPHAVHPLERDDMGRLKGTGQRVSSGPAARNFVLAGRPVHRWPIGIRGKQAN